MVRLRWPTVLSLAASSTKIALASPNSLSNKTAFVAAALSGTTATVSSSTMTQAVPGGGTPVVDQDFPGTAVERMIAARQRAQSLTAADLNQDWPDVRRKILWAGGLKDLPESIPGQGYTGHSFNDYNHVDLTCMADQVSNNENDGSVKEIARGNLLGPGIRVASLPELGPGGSWSTCANGCNKEPPQDVAHVQFRARIAFKMVWVPGPNEAFDSFVLVDDDGEELNRGTPTGTLPHIRQRQMNYSIVQGSKYAKAADTFAAST